MARRSPAGCAGAKPWSSLETGSVEWPSGPVAVERAEFQATAFSACAS